MSTFPGLGNIDIDLQNRMPMPPRPGDIDLPGPMPMSPGPGDIDNDLRGLMPMSPGRVGQH